MSLASDRIVLVTGANGQVGRHALMEYADGTKANHIIATDITRNFWVPPEGFRCGFEYIKADFREPRELQRLADTVLRRDENHVYVPDIGALFRYDVPRIDLYESNVVGQENLMNHVVLPLMDKGRTVRTVFWGAAAVYGNFDNSELLPAREHEYPIDPQNDYALSKYIAERTLLQYHHNHNVWITIMRCGAVYGEWGRYGMANAIILQLLGMLEALITGSGKNHVALVHARDTVRIAEILANQEKANGRIFNVRDDSEYTLEEVARAQANACDVILFEKLHIPVSIFQQFLIDPLRRLYALKGIEPVVDPELAKMIPLDSFLSIAALKELFEQEGIDFRSHLLYPDSIKGITDVTGWFKTIGAKEGYFNV